MRYTAFNSYLLAALVASSIGLAGCKDAADPKVDPTKVDVHSLPTSIEDAIEDLKEHLGEISESIKNKDFKAADGAVHHVGEIFESIPKLVAASPLGEESKKLATEASEKLMKSFESIDTALHSDKEKVESEVTTAYEKVEKEIESAMADLSEAVKKKE